jgi:F-type H+-transporting ATPase subunit alpha
LRCQTCAVAANDIYQRLLKSIQEGTDAQPRMMNVGTVISVGDGVARISGIEQVMASELLEFPVQAGRNEAVFGIALNLERDTVSAIVLGDYLSIQEGDQVNATGRIISAPVGQALVGRVVNALGQPIDGKGTIQSDGTPSSRTYRPWCDGSSIGQRAWSQTGVIAIDAMIPIGRGQT